MFNLPWPISIATFACYIANQYSYIYIYIYLCESYVLVMSLILYIAGIVHISESNYAGTSMQKEFVGYNYTYTVHVWILCKCIMLWLLST